MRIAITLFICGALLCLAPATANAELTLSITITGTPDELIPLLEQLRDMGIGAESESDPVRMEMHSVSGNGDAAGAAVDAESSSEPPGLWGAVVTPATARPGEDVLVTLEVDDPAQRIDTIACVIKEGDGMLFDLYDNGTHGDEVADDGVWSYALSVPNRLDVDAYTINIIPYDRQGDEIVITAEDGTEQPLGTTLTVPVAR